MVWNDTLQYIFVVSNETDTSSTSQVKIILYVKMRCTPLDALLRQKVASMRYRLPCAEASSRTPRPLKRTYQGPGMAFAALRAPLSVACWYLAICMRSGCQSGTYLLVTNRPRKENNRQRAVFHPYTSFQERVTAGKHPMRLCHLWIRSAAEISGAVSCGCARYTAYIFFQHGSLSARSARLVLHMGKSSSS